MIEVGVYDAKSYDRQEFERAAGDDIRFHYFDFRLDESTARMAKGLNAVCAFVNDDLSAPVVAALYAAGIRMVALRCAGYNQVDLKATEGKIKVYRVPGYSPYAVAEHAFALLMCLNRKIHRAYIRTRDHNFSLAGLTGFDLNGKTCGVIGTGRIGQAFLSIAGGLGMRLLAFDPKPVPGLCATYTDLETLLRLSDVISLHCPLTPDTRHLLGAAAFELTKPKTILLNTSRGALVDSPALLEALRTGRLGGAGLDVYEEEGDYFFEDVSGEVLDDTVLSLLLTMPGVLITSHQGFLTEEALEAIAQETAKNIRDFFAGRETANMLKIGNGG